MAIGQALMAVCCVLLVYAQNCKVGGKRCADHEQCCGGCCFDGVCVDTYKLCTSSLDVCEGHVCMGEESCVTYAPPQCPACEPVPVCTVL